MRGAWPNQMPPMERNEFLLDLGRTIRQSARHGQPILVRSQDLGLARQMLELAQAFANASDLIKFRALVEDWSLQEISAAVGRQQSD